MGSGMLISGIAAVLAGAANYGSVLVAMDAGPVSEKSFSVQVSAAQQPAVSFALPGQEYRIDSVTLNLRDYSSASDAPVVGFYNDDHGRPGTLLGSPLRNPPSASNRSANFTFLPESSLLLRAGGTYWVMLSSAFGSYSWNAAGAELGAARTPFGEAAFRGYKVGLNYGEVFVDDNPVPFFTISATAVPEPATIALALLGAAAVLRRGKGRPKTALARPGPP